MLKEATFGAVVGFVGILALAHCGESSIVACKVAAVKMLPDDPEQLSFGDVVDLASRLRACKAQGDAGP